MNQETLNLILKLVNHTDNSNQTDEPINKFDIYKGKYVIVRSYSEGINAGYLEEADETGVVLRRARRLHYHECEDKSLSWYEGVSKVGLGSSSRVSSEVERKIIIENYSITPCTDVAASSIKSFKTHSTSC